MYLSTANTTLRRYFQEINRYPLLTREQEHDLAVAMTRGNLLAREKLINSNLRFVISLARRLNKGAVPLEDLISAGNEGLVRAAADYEPDRGVKFISYAVAWIRSKMQQAIWKERVVRLPYHMMVKSMRIRAFELEHPEWDDERLSKETGVSKGDLKLLRQHDVPMTSLDYTIPSDEGSEPMIQTIPDERKYPEEALINFSLGKLLVEAMDRLLTQAERNVMIFYYGLGGGGSHTPSELAEVLKISKTRVLELRRSALLKLKGPEYQQLLELFREDS